MARLALAGLMSVMLVGAAGVVGIGVSMPTAAATPGVIDVPAGTVVHFTGVTLWGCNDSTWGYRLGNDAPVTVNSKPYNVCSPSTYSDLSIGPFASATTLRVFLIDNHCGDATFYSDGTPVAHAVISGVDPWFIGIADGGGNCERVNDPATDFLPQYGNLSVNVSLTPAQTQPEASVAVGTQGLVSGAVSQPCLGGPLPPRVNEDTSFVVTLSQSNSEATSVNLKWGGTAVSDVDYTNHPASIAVPADSTSVTIPADIAPSAADKTIVLTITDGSGYSIGSPAEATATIALAPTIALGCAPTPPTPPEVNPNFTG